ncbi:copper amine oxidase N-terminal domain-containing protein [Paratissierella segnis]|uniref:Copper amine oxidase N-terminal domain-containing protein n=1 Tax=Paratissierella segnis TaxID=2763679 RepID=A0A926IJ77_9FIRM|nr:copper amine oxidase N-terminal domain-containing protein [Paratissierella segnis]MBC8586950.1 copper amine oxidase N-terminal domain-containing protein [Paratissierella segnis]
MKKKACFILSLVLILTLSCVAVFADSEIIVKIDSEKVEFNEDVGFPFVDENGRTLVPFKAALEKYGAEVNWDNENRTAIAKKGDIAIKVPIGEKFILKNDEKIETDTVAVIKDDRTYLPIRPVMEAFGSEVQWDNELKAVLITTEPIDAKEVLLDAYAKSYAWKNFDAKMKMEMSIAAPDEEGVVQNLSVLMDMEMTAFQDPLKAKASADMQMGAGEEKLTQHLMDMYYDLDGKKFTMYMGMPNEDGEIEWVKQTQENEIFETLNKDNKEKLELDKEALKEVKFLGKYDEDGKSLLKLEATMSYDAYLKMLDGYMDMLMSSEKEEDKLAADMLKNIGDMTYIVYVDEESHEIVKYEMNLGSLRGSMFDNLFESEDMPEEVLEQLKDMKMEMHIEYLNVNEAKDFEIPEEVLKAPEAPAVEAPEKGK